MPPLDEISNGPSAQAAVVRRRLLDCYQRGVHLATREKNYEYAQVMFAECVLHDPGNLQFVEAMIQSLRKRTGGTKRSLFFVNRRRSRILRKATQQERWNDVLQNGLELIRENPWDTATLRAMASACAALHHNEVELSYLKQALDSDPKDPEVNRHCARSLGRMGQFDQAIACWHRVEKLMGKDNEATCMISALAEDKLKYPGGRPPAPHVRPGAMLESDPKGTLQDVVLSPNQKLEQAIGLDPLNVANYVELAGRHILASRFDAAEVVLSRGVASCGEDFALLEQLKRVRHLRLEEHQQYKNQKIEPQFQNRPRQTRWPELCLAGTVILLVLQLFPSVPSTIRAIIDFRDWSRFGWIGFNVFVLVALIGAQCAPVIRLLIGSWRVPRRSGPPNDTSCR